MHKARAVQKGEAEEQPAGSTQESQAAATPPNNAITTIHIPFSLRLSVTPRNRTKVTELGGAHRATAPQCVPCQDLGFSLLRVDISVVLVVGVGSLSGAETGSFGERGTAECEESALDYEITSHLGHFTPGWLLRGFQGGWHLGMSDSSTPWCEDEPHVSSVICL